MGPAGAHPYATAAYAVSLSHVGEPLHVPEWGTYVLVRPAGEGLADATGSYPLAMVTGAGPSGVDWAGGVERLRREGLVSVVLTVDAVHVPSPDVAGATFQLVRPFKTHFLHDPARPVEVSPHHQREIARAAKAVRVEPFPLIDRLDDWIGLYAELGRRRGLSGVHDFPIGHHQALTRLPGVIAIGAFAGDELINAHIFVCGHGRATSHLAASNARGYAVGAAYAVNAAAIERLGQDQVINFGGGAGLGDVADDGLSRFKRGFANATAPSHLLGAILAPKAYARLATAKGRTTALSEAIFPSYRG